MTRKIDFSDLDLMLIRASLASTIKNREQVIKEFQVDGSIGLTALNLDDMKQLLDRIDQLDLFK